ncbi:TPA: hypothetical protein QCU37_005771 [Bacillus cereus]|nr:hypothetical protein [Bacillus cereus]
MAWDNGPAFDLIVRTHEKVKKFYDLLWLQKKVSIVIHFSRGAIKVKLSQVVGVKNDIKGQYEYRFFWGEKSSIYLKCTLQNRH